jgi:alpha-amylase
MGYDPYDYFDLGDFDQKGSTKTLYGNRAELEKLIRNARAQDGRHRRHGHQPQLRRRRRRSQPARRQKRWTKFNPKSGKFPRDWNCFHPSRYERS